MGEALAWKGAFFLVVSIPSCDYRSCNEAVHGFPASLYSSALILSQIIFNKVLAILALMETEYMKI